MKFLIQYFNDLATSNGDKTEREYPSLEEALVMIPDSMSYGSEYSISLFHINGERIAHFSMNRSGVHTTIDKY